MRATIMGYDDKSYAEARSPSRIADPRLRLEARKAFVWIGIAVLIGLALYMAQALLVIFGGLVFAALVDGGARLLGRILPVRRGFRIAIVMILTTAFFVWLLFFAGSQLAQQAAQFPALIQTQADQLLEWVQSQGLALNTPDTSTIVRQVVGGLGELTRIVGGVVGGFTTMFLIIILGIYFSAEPRLYERGLAWFVPLDHRDGFVTMINSMSDAMRRLMFGRIIGMAFEGVLTWIALTLYGVPLAGLLGLLTGLLAFIPNVGAIISGLLMILVGFSGGTDMALYTLGVYAVVQTFDGYIVVPMIARKTVDLAPALVLAVQLILGVLFGILGLALADPLAAMIKTMLEHRSKTAAEAGPWAAEG
ncbi:AI-2E family transporter [Croceicoccus sp. F390]|uniref:AI-2E family transporter n=1 Tax=Croceicoccus esteveae TaxID=3075597 RepID=A0ABU2ZF87_9SPHN|nr:AI-2E family transporter [Croceicoccus sp. F390]MDT0575259.1 AI-2E family transporter [Croceicoccus sp. F390]